MAQTAANAFNATPLVTGPIWWAPLATVLPTSEVTAPVAAFKSLGYIGEDGITLTEGRDTTKIKAFGGDTILVVQSDHTVTLQFSLLEFMNEEVAKAVNGDTNVIVTPATSTVGTRLATVKNAKKLPHKTWLVDVLDDQKKLRLCVPDGQITTIGDANLVHTNVISRQVTVECFADALGNKLYEYANNGVPSGA
ncbi:phage tail tube protein [Rhodococcus sp. Leaf233]|uniref:phage tail tube protein n=1 Tax=Rhodococcus sp. Leaf233 TaxID=1736302 RepID=UPI00070B7686|nr:hypothetical protein [Rhodococcus sp. Leaf233]KQU33567.1 hypothetical protein ASH04_06965 [Rhodococcus sp. Leaf233]